jgi:glycosyltransferase involved in cell wall biosynthesis
MREAAEPRTGLAANSGGGGAEGAARRPVSVAIVARNESARIGACLDSVAWADEVIVLDSGSEDDTREICRARGAKVLEQSWEGYSAQKNFAAGEARHPWILSLDADEVVSAPLRERILAVLAADGPADGYRLPRKNIFFGKWLRHGDHWPDHQIRLFRKGRGRFNGKPVHESVEVDGVVAELTEPLEHYSYDNIEDFFARQLRYAALAAGELHSKGRSPGAGDFLFRPLWRFMKGYVLKSGWRDGREGFIASAGYAYYVFMRTAFLWERRRGRETT